MTLVPPKPKNSFRVTLVATRKFRLDALLMAALKAQDQNILLTNISRGALKALFGEKKIQIKGQNAKPSSMIAVGTTYVDILGFEQD
jgi:hypothetical protein